MASVGLQPDPDQESEQIEDGEEIVDRFVRGELTLKQFIALLPKMESEVMPSAS